MPINPNRKGQGGDVEGEEATDVGLGQTLKPLMVSRASFDAGYDNGIDYGSDMDDTTKAELKQGYSSYGRTKIGE